MIEKVEYGQEALTALITRLPQANQSFYYNLTHNNVLDEQAYADVFCVLNYELTLLSIQKKHIDTVSTEDLNQLTPWVRNENRDAWCEMLQTTPAQDVCPYFSLLLESRKKILMHPFDAIKSEDLESMMLNIMKAQKEYIAWTKEEEALRLTAHASTLNHLKNQSDITLHISALLDLLKENEALTTFYQDILTNKSDETFKIRLIKVLRMEIALSALDDTLEVTMLKLDKVIEMLDETIGQEYKALTNKQLEPRVLHKLLQTELSLLKDDLKWQVKEQLMQIEQRKERKKLSQKEQVEAVYAQILQERQEKERQRPLLKRLQEIHFDEYLAIFRHKAAHYAASNTDEYQRALHATNTLIDNVLAAKTSFLSVKHLSQEQLDASLKNQCLSAIETAREVLKEHRGWKEILANFASAIVSVLSLGFANYLTGRGFFSLFPTKTDGVEQLDGFTCVLLN